MTDDQTTGRRPADDRQTAVRTDDQASGQSSGQTGQASGRPGITARQLAYARGCSDGKDCYSECVELARRQLDGWDRLDADFRAEIWGRVAIVEGLGR